jgi:hypothetical protein
VGIDQLLVQSEIQRLGDHARPNSRIEGEEERQRERQSKQQRDAKYQKYHLGTAQRVFESPSVCFYNIHLRI